MASSTSSQTRCFQGPRDGTVFCLQEMHLSAQVFRGERPSDSVAKARRADGNIWEQWVFEMGLSPRTAHFVELLGFGTFFKLGHMRVDNALMDALLERFRPETHTFHLPVGEAMISLEDVEVLLGLNVDGYYVGSNPARLTVPGQDWDSYVQHTLGLEPLPHGSSYFYSEMLITTHLVDRLHRPVVGTDADLAQRARCFVLWMMGGYLFINSKKIHLRRDMVLCVSDFEVCRGYSWGSAVLAYLLRDLSRCALLPPSNKIYMNGATQLLQYWAYERISVFRPDFKVQNDGSFGLPVAGGPWGSRYTEQRTVYVRHSVKVYRDQLASFSWEQFEWTPYRTILPSLPLQCRSGWGIYLCTVPMIYGLWVAFHNPHRCVRQFGGIQTVPALGLALTTSNWKIHVEDRYISVSGRNEWRRNYLNDYINMWNERRNHILYLDDIDLNRGPLSDPSYEAWYVDNSVRYTLDPDVRNIRGFNPHGHQLVYQTERIQQFGRSWAEQPMAPDFDAFMGSVARTPFIDPPATVQPTQFMRNPPGPDAPVRQRRHRRTRQEAEATQQAYNAQFGDPQQHQQQQQAIPEPQFQEQQRGLDDINVNDYNWDQMVPGGGGGDDWESFFTPYVPYGEAGGSGGGGYVPYGEAGGSGGGGGYVPYGEVGGSGGGGGYVPYGEVDGRGGRHDLLDLDLNVSLWPSEEAPVVQVPQTPYETPAQQIRRMTRPVGRPDSNQHVRPLRNVAFGDRPRRFNTPPEDDSD